MPFGTDERGQAIQIGAVLLFGLLVIAFATYQAFVVPAENKKVEFKHSQQVQQELQDLRNAVVSLSGSRVESVAVPLGTQYPSRAFALNPAPPSGTIRTAGTRNASLNLTIRNATGTGEVRDFWNGSTHRYATGALVYRPNYNEFRSAPTVVYENTVLFNQYRDQNVTLTGQLLVDDRSITLVTLNGTLSESRSGSYTVEVDPVSVSETRVDVSNASHNVTVTFPTRLGVGKWRELLAGEFTEQGGHVAGVTAEPLGGGVQLLHVDLEPGVEYDLRMKKVGVGTRVRDTSAGYVLPVEGNATTVPEGGTARIVVEVRDGYNNPIGGRRLNASASLPGGSVTPTRKQTNSDGQVVLTYDAPDDVSGTAQRTDRINVSFAVGSPNLNTTAFDASSPANATIPVRVTNADSSGLGGGGGGGGAYDVEWVDTSSTGVSCDAALEDCTVDGSATSTVDLTAGTTPTADGAAVSYAVSNQTVGTVSPTSGTTDSSGKDTTTFRLRNNGTVKVYASSGGGGDIVNLDVNNFKASGIGEIGRVSFAAGTNQKTITLAQSYRNPVIIAKPVDDSAPEPRYVRVVGNTSSSVTLEVDEFGSGDTNPATTVHYMVMETGVHELEDGTKIEVGSNMVDGSWDTVTYKNSFGATPVVFSQTQTVNDDTPVVVRQRNVDDNDFEHKLQEGEGQGQTGHATERVGYVAIQGGTSGTTGGAAFEVGTTGNTVEGYDNGFTPISFSQSYSQTPAFFAQMQTEDGGNTAWERYRNLDQNGAEVTIDEETTGDGERSHTTENVAYFAFEELGVVDGTTLSSPGGGGGGGGAGFSSVSASDIQKGQSSTTQTLSFTLDSTLASGETVDIDLSDAQGVKNSKPDPVDYGSAGIDGSSNLASGSAQFTTQNQNDAIVTFTASNGDISGGTTIDVVLNGVRSQNGQTSGLQASFSRSDGGSQTTTFGVTN